MGLLDFFSKNKSQNSSIQSGQTGQPYQDNSQSNFSNVSYPLPNTSIPASAPIPDQYNAGTVQAQNYSAVAPAAVQPTAQEPAANTQATESAPPDIMEAGPKPIKAEDVKSENSYTSVTPEGVKTVTFEPQEVPPPAEPQPILPVSSEVQPLTTQVSQPTEVQQQINNQADAAVNLQPNSNMLVDFKSNVSDPAPIAPTIETPTDQQVLNTQTNMDNSAVQQETLSPLLQQQFTTTEVPPIDQQVQQPVERPVQAPVTDSSSNTSTNVEVGTNPTEYVSPLLPVPASEATAATEVAGAVAIEQTVPPTENSAYPLNPTVTQDNLSDLQKDIDTAAQQPQPVETVPEVQPVQAPDQEEQKPSEVVQPVVEQSPADTEVDPEPDTLPDLKIFKRIAFLSLNVDNPNPKVNLKVKELADVLSKVCDELIIDSSKGYGKDLLETASQNSSKITGVYLKPNYAHFSDDSEMPQNPKYTTIVYSNFIDRLKDIIKQGQLFIIPETTNVYNASQMFMIWAAEYMYAGTHKPIVLLGKGWKQMLDSIKSTFKLSDTELSFINIAETVIDAVNVIVKLDSEYQAKESVTVKNVIDMREANDETEFFMNSK